MDSEDEEITLTNFDSKSEGETLKTVVKTAWKEKKRVEIPFEEDTLCKQCSAIFTRDITWGYHAPNRLKIEPRNTSECRICALLLSRFPSFLKTDGNSGEILEVEYNLRNRYGYFMQIHDIAFRPVGWEKWNENIVRLALQQHVPTDSGYPDMVPYDTTLSSSTKSDESMALAQKWMKNCMENHKSCIAAISKVEFLPKRLVEIHGEGVDDLWIKLVESAKCEIFLGTAAADETKAVPRYGTLSHCWGKVMPYKLETGNIDECYGKIPMAKISKVFQDAIEIAFRSNLRYLWIDSLCIIQNSLSDWETESSLMGSIYSNSILNIAATGFPSGENGLFSVRDANLMTPIRVVLPEDMYVQFDPEREGGTRQKEATKGNYFLVDVHTWKDGVDESPLCKRGWVAQERALSVRTLHFGKSQLFYDCLSGSFSEVFPQGFVRGTFQQHPKTFLNPREQEYIDQSKKLIKARDREVKMNREIEEMDARHKKHMEDMKEYYEKYPEDMVSWNLPKSRFGADSDRNFSDLCISHKDFIGVDKSLYGLFDGLGMKGWDEFKERLVKWKVIEEGPTRVAASPIRGMTLAQQQWRTVVEMFSGCQLSYSKDKLVAISGMAKMIADDMKCAYLAGMWRRDLEHQLLWKCTAATKAVQLNGTRGPSWAWAAVDGPVTLWDWRGYFYNGEPGEIEWLSQVDSVHVQPTNHDEFGQIKSGALTITGRLGVFRISKDKSNKPGSHTGNLVGSKKSVRAYFDNTTYESTFGVSSMAIPQDTDLWRYNTFGTTQRARAKLNPLDLFFLPVRVMDCDPDVSDYEQPMLTGLLLLPTGKKRGEFTRVGMYEISVFWLPNRDEGLKPFLGRTDILDDRFYMKKHGNGDYTVTIV